MLLVALIVANGLKMAADLVAISSGMALLHGGSALLRALVAGAVTIVLLVLGSFARIALASGLLCAVLPSCRRLPAIPRARRSRLSRHGGLLGQKWEFAVRPQSPPSSTASSPSVA